MEKYINEVFKDFDVNSNISKAQIENINLYKKLNKLQVDIVSNEPITINEIGEFENYLQNRFNIGKALTNIKYEDVEIEQNIDKNWNNIVTYITEKEPFSRALLTNSSVFVDGKNVDVKLKMKGAEFLSNKKFDKGLEHLFKNVYNDNFQVKIEDDLEENYFEKIEKNFIEAEEKAVKDNENARKAQIAAQDASVESFVLAEGENKNSNKNKYNSEKNEYGKNYYSKNSNYQKPLKELPPGMIFGRSAKLRGTPIKINNISPETENVVITGETIRVDSNEMRSKPDKAILIFDVYDGTSTITCKAFVEKAKLPRIY